MPKPLLEQATLVESVNKKTGKILVDIVTPGDGTSGYYSPEVCEAAAGLVTAGTQMFLDHPTEAEEYERPIRSVKDIAAVFTESARWDPDRGESGSLVAEAQVVPAWIETMDVIQGAIGVSIRGSATDIIEGEVDGRQKKIIEGLHSIDSVDFVTRAGRGGAFALMESAAPSRVHARAQAHGVSEATVNDTREALQTVLRDAYGGDKVYVWVRDFDDSTVWFEVEDGDGSGCYGQTYTQSDAGAVALDGDRTEVRVSTTYVPVRPGGTTPTEESLKENPMPEIKIDEAEHTRLVTEAGRVTALEAERDTAVTERDHLRTENQRLTARESAATHARTRITEANAGLPAATVDRIVAQATVTVPLTEAGQLDTAALDTAVDAARTAEETYLAGLAEAAGIGSITGFGGAPAGGQTPINEAQLDAAVGGAFGRQVKEA